jgi:hypothetical protein
MMAEGGHEKLGRGVSPWWKLAVQACELLPAFEKCAKRLSNMSSSGSEVCSSLCLEAGVELTDIVQRCEHT